MSFDPPVYQSENSSNALSIAIVAARYNTILVEALIENTLNTLKESDIEPICLERVPGSAELPYAASLIEKSHSLDAIIALGVIIAGETDHHSVIAYSGAQALNQISTKKNIPIINGVIVTNSQKEAEDRCGSKVNRGREFALAAIEMAQLKEKMDEKQSIKKPNPRRANRMTAVQFLYQWEANKPDELLDSVSTFFSNQEENRDYYSFSESLVLGAIENISEIDEAISKQAKNWKFDRIAKVDLAVLRLALYELLFRDDIPPIVSINEAIDLGKTFSNLESKRFINGILDEVKKEYPKTLKKS